MWRSIVRSAAPPLIGGALTLVTDGALGQELSPPALFPMTFGNTWVYTGTIRWTPAGSNDVLDSVEPEIARTRYRVSHRTLPDHRILEYVSDVGMTSYVHAHHGTVAEVDVRLTEAKLEPR